MKNKKNNLLIISIIGIILFCGVFAIGYPIMKKNDQKIRNEAIFNIVRQYVESDVDFASQYGKIQTMSLHHNEDIIIINSKECHVPCIVNMENGKSYLVWVDYDFSYDEDKFTYIRVDIIDSNE